MCSHTDGIYLRLVRSRPDMEKTGASQLIASGIQGAVAGWNQIIILCILFAIVAVLTQFMSDAGTTAIFAPVAEALAHVLDHAPEPYVIIVAMAAVTAFLTPIGHHGNLLVYGPENY
jgi:di/tricarboxylate transporter